MNVSGSSQISNSISKSRGYKNHDYLNLVKFNRFASLFQSFESIHLIFSDTAQYHEIDPNFVQHSQQVSIVLLIINERVYVIDQTCKQFTFYTIQQIAQVSLENQ